MSYQSVNTFESKIFLNSNDIIHNEQFNSNNVILNFYTKGSNKYYVLDNKIVGAKVYTIDDKDTNKHYGDPSVCVSCNSKLQ